MLKQRIISALVLVLSLGSIVLYVPDDILVYFAVLIASLSFWEFLKIRFSNSITFISLPIFISLLFLSHFSFFNNLFISVSVLIYFVSCIFVLSFPLNKTLLKNSFSWLLVGFSVHLGFFSAIFQIINIDSLSNLSLSFENERLLILYIIFISILMDSIAFFAGKNFGKRPFIPNVSPNKTMEGFMSAILITPLFLLILSTQLFDLSLLSVFLILIVVSFYSVIGDAVASLMKRVVEVKDYSNLIPGHGGLFDRLDSHIAAFPCFILLLNILSK